MTAVPWFDFANWDLVPGNADGGFVPGSPVPAQPPWATALLGGVLLLPMIYFMRRLSATGSSAA